MNLSQWKDPLFLLATVLWAVVSSASAGTDSAAIRFDADHSCFILKTESVATILAITPDRSLVTLQESLFADPEEVPTSDTEALMNSGAWKHSLPVRGGFPRLAPALEARFSDGVRGLRLEYQSHEIAQLEGAPLLRIDLKDELYPLSVGLFFRVMGDLDIVERWMTVRNLGQEPILLDNASSASLILDRNRYDLIHSSGRWGHEFQLERTSLTDGAKLLDVRGMRFHHRSPWYLIRPAGDSKEEVGKVWFGALGWSGNWVLRFEKMPTGELQILGGINFWDTSWTLGPGTEFTTPKFISGSCFEGPGGASRRLHRYIRRYVLPSPNRDKLRPVLYNSWYATTFQVNDSQQVALARIASEIGVELFVMDDGWFKGRKDDHAGLGDWVPDEDKFPDGLNPMIESIGNTGLDFGLWVEPEMVNPDSDLYRQHPDWALHTPGRNPLQQRNQLVLNLARDEVKEFTWDWFGRLLSENPLSFVKWDYNRDQAEVDWPGVAPDRAREVRIRYVQNLYEVFERTRKQQPNLLLEGCAGGGGRVDVGILRYVDQVWTSDNTNPADRVFIQYGFSQAFPANTMVSWTTDDDWRGVNPSLEYRFRVAMSGVLGVGNDLRQWGEEEKGTARREIALYKQIRPLVQMGDLYRLVSPFEEDRAALCYVSENKRQAVVFMYNLQVPLPGSRVETREEARLRLRGLDGASDYSLSVDLAGTASGRTLMEYGIPWLPRGNYEARIVQLERREK
jgi:alpha-galactosidase